MQLKSDQPDFEVVDGPCKGRVYFQGVDYEEKDIPPQEREKFEVVKKLPAAKNQPADKTAKTSAKNSEKSA